MYTENSTSRPGIFLKLPSESTPVKIKKTNCITKTLKVDDSGLFAKFIKEQQFKDNIVKLNNTSKRMRNSGEIPERKTASGFIININKPTNPEANKDDNYFTQDKLLIKRNSLKSVSLSQEKSPRLKSPRLSFNDDENLVKEASRIFNKSKEKENGGEYIADKFSQFIKK
jgi:hypothetical protein